MVTGADGGIGSAITASLRAAGIEVIPLTHADGDFSRPEVVQQLAAQVETTHPSIDWIVFAHGHITTPVENVELTFAVNTLSLFWFAQAFMPLLTTPGGMIALTSSAGLSPNGFYPAYSASKAAANALMQALARKHADASFFAIAPGPTNTEMRERVAGDAARMQDPSIIADVVRTLIDGTGDYRSGDVLLVRDGATSIASRLA